MKTMLHTVSSCRQTKMEGDLQQFKMADNAAVKWLCQMARECTWQRTITTTTTTTSGQHKHKFLCHPLHPCEFIVSNAAVWVRAAATSRLHLYSKRQLHVIRKQRIDVELYAEQCQRRVHHPKTRHRVVVLLNVTIDIWAQHGVVLHTNSKLLIVSPPQDSHMTRSFISRNDHITPWHTTTRAPWCVYFIYVPWRYVEK